MTEARAVRLVKAALRGAGLPEAEGGTMPGRPVTRAGWRAWRDGAGARVAHWGVTVLTEPEKRAALAGYASVLQAEGWTVTVAGRGAFLAVTAATGEQEMATAGTGDRVTFRGRPSVHMQRAAGGLSVSHGYGWFTLDAAEWEAFKAEGDRLMAGGEAEGNGDD